MTTCRVSLLIFVLPFVLLAHAEQSAPSPILVFTHVTVIDGTGAPARPAMTVVMMEGRISAVGTTGEVPVPPEAQVVDASGKFMIPGLWDMHVHWYRKDSLSLFIANGVTGVRQMWGRPMHHAWRTEIEHGSLLGPRMVIASPIVDGPNPIWPGSISVGNAAEAREAVRTLKQAGADFMHIAPCGRTPGTSTFSSGTGSLGG